MDSGHAVGSHALACLRRLWRSDPASRASRRETTAGPPYPRRRRARAARSARSFRERISADRTNLFLGSFRTTPLAGDDGTVTARDRACTLGLSLVSESVSVARRRLSGTRSVVFPHGHLGERVQRSLVRRSRSGRNARASSLKFAETTLSQAWSGNRIRGPQCAFEMSMFMCPAVHKLTRN